MTYEYTDTGKSELLILSMNGAYIECSREQEGHGVHVKPEDAPAIALAILEAAGVDPDDIRTGTEYTREAVYHLQRHKRELDEAQAREAEDAKVRAWMRYTARAESDEHDWVTLREKDREIYRDECRRNREFFTRSDDGTDYHADAEKPAPRVLNYGDPEPDRGTKWRDSEGEITRYTDGMWRSFGHDTGRSTGTTECWTHIPSRFFPMTEVTS